jgi:hypothetical protein
MALVLGAEDFIQAVDSLEVAERHGVDVLAVIYLL